MYYEVFKGKAIDLLGMNSRIISYQVCTSCLALHFVWFSGPPYEWDWWDLETSFDS